MRSKCGLGWVRSVPDEPWTPRQLRPALWLRSDLGVTVAAGVSSWADHGGNGYHAVQAVGSRQPEYVPSAVGLFPGIRFSRLDTNMQLISTGSYPVGTSKFCVYTVTYMTADDLAAQAGFYADSICFGGPSSVFMAPCGHGTIDKRASAGIVGTASNSGVGAVVTDALFLHSFGHVSGSMIHRGGNTVVSVGPWVASNATSLSIGNYITGTIPFIGTAFEYVVFAREVTSFENSQVISYLASRYSRPWTT